MNKVLFFVLLSLSGCTLAPRQPIDVALIPDDCANREAIIRWLEQSANTPRNFSVSKEEYESLVSSAKHRIWHLRYHCQPAG